MIFANQFNFLVRLTQSQFNQVQSSISLSVRDAVLAGLAFNLLRAILALARPPTHCRLVILPSPHSPRLISSTPADDNSQSLASH